MTSAAVMAVVYPFFAGQTQVDRLHDIAVYKDQLKEIDADEKLGLIAAEEAASAKIEVSRRLLKADVGPPIAPKPKLHFPTSFIVTAAALAVPFISLGLYSALGSPNVPDQPTSARVNPAMNEATIETLVAKAEQHLATNPKDGKGWEVLAPIYFRMSKFEKSIQAYEMAGRLNGKNASYEIGIGQALAGMNGGKVNDQARAAFKRAEEIDPANPEPKIIIAVDLAQQGKFGEAKASLERVLSEAPSNAPWRAAVSEMLTKIDEKITQPPSLSALGPTPEDVAAAQDMSTTDRKAMIEGMVAQLDARLTSNPTDVEGWKRLLQSYVVLENRTKASEVLLRARIGLKDNSADLEQINLLAVKLGVTKP